MQGDHGVLGMMAIELVAKGRLLNFWFHGHQGVDHDVANANNFRSLDARGQEVLISIWRRCPKEVSEVVRDDSVEFFGHPSVTASQARLQVNDGNTEFGGSQRTGDGAVDVTDDDGGCRTALKQQRLVPFKD